MKWIKTFEELKPETYRSAGRKLNQIGKKDRGNELIDYGNEKEYGFYSMWYAPEGDPISDYNFTKPHASFEMIPDIIEQDKLSPEDMINRWQGGNGNLKFTITFSFKATEKVSYYNTAGKTFPLFSFEVIIANYIKEEEEDEENTYKLYNNKKTLEINVVRPALSVYSEKARKYYRYNGIFSDRKSALKFKKELPNLITDEIQEKIQEIFSLVGAETDDVINCMEGIMNPSINYLYSTRDKMNSKPVNIYQPGNIIQNPSKYKPSDIPKPIEKPSTVTTTGNYKPVYNIKREQ